MKKNNTSHLGADKFAVLNQALTQLSDIELSESEITQSWKRIHVDLSDKKVSPIKKLHNKHWFAMAASIVFISVLMVQFNQQSSSDGGWLQTENNVTKMRLDESITDVMTLKRINETLRARLDALPQPVIMRANTMDTITRLEDRIHAMDYRLNISEYQPLTLTEKKAIYQERARTMQGLYQVKAAQARRSNQYLANSLQPVAY